MSLCVTFGAYQEFGTLDERHRKFYAEKHCWIRKASNTFYIAMYHFKVEQEKKHRNIATQYTTGRLHKHWVF